LRICNVIQRYPPAVGGSETWCQEVCRYVAKQGSDVSVLTLDVYDEAEFWRDPSPDKCTVRFGPCNFDGNIKVRRYRRDIPNYYIYHSVYKFLDRGLGLYFYGPHSSEMYREMYREIKGSDILHTHTLPYPHNFFSLLNGKLADKKIVITPHFHPNHPHYERKILYWLLNRCDSVITVSDYEKDYLMGAGVDPEKISVTGNGVNPDLYVLSDEEQYHDCLKMHDIDDNTKVVTFIGRKADYKGVDTLIAAAKKILPVRKDTKFLLVGPRLPWFEQLYSGLSPEERQYIIDIGYISQQEKVYLLHRSDILCLPSKFEAFGIVFLEAWICNTPVIGSDQGAQPSVIGEDGVTFHYGDANDLAEKILYLLDDEKASRRMAENGKNKVLERYTWDKIGEKVLQVYNSLVE
jgi:glycosyltransferase involved in cell wall biosynthesis